MILAAKIKDAWPFEPITPYCLERFKPEIKKDIFTLFIIACIFYFNGIFHKGSLFAPDVWGHFATQFPAQMWAFISLLGCAVILVGLLKPPIGMMVSIGAFVMALNFAALGLSAMLTSNNSVGFFIGLYTFVHFAPKFLRIFIMGVRSYGAK